MISIIIILGLISVKQHGFVCVLVAHICLTYGKVNNSDLGLWVR